MRTLNLITVCALAAGLSACSGDDTPQPATDNTPASIVLTAEQQTYLDGLRAIDAGLVVNVERALGRAENICLDLAGGEFTEAQLAERVVQRLSGGNATINAEQATQVITLAKATVC